MTEFHSSSRVKTYWPTLGAGHSIGFGSTEKIAVGVAAGEVGVGQETPRERCLIVTAHAVKVKVTQSHAWTGQGRSEATQRQSHTTCTSMFGHTHAALTPPAVCVSPTRAVQWAHP